MPDDIYRAQKPANQLWCCNCTKRGHDSTTCTNYRWSQHFVTPRFVTSYTKGPSYQKGDTRAPPPPEIDTSHQQKKPPKPANPKCNKSVVFSYTNYPPSEGSRFKSRTISSNQLVGDLAYQKTSAEQHPQFFMTHFPQTCPCKLTVLVYFYNSQDRFEIVLKSNRTTIDTVVKIMLQWLIRSSEDRETMNATTTAIPRFRINFSNLFSTKMDEFASRTNPRAWKHLKTLKSTAQIVRNLQLSISNGEEGKLKTELEKRSRQIERLKLRIVAALYNYGLFANTKETLQEFQNFISMSQLPSSSTSVSPYVYVAGVWYYFEFFIPHLSPYIDTAVKDWERKMRMKKGGSEPTETLTPMIQKSPNLNDSLGGDDKIDEPETSLLDQSYSMPTSGEDHTRNESEPAQTQNEDNGDVLETMISEYNIQKGMRLANPSNIYGRAILKGLTTTKPMAKKKHKGSPKTPKKRFMDSRKKR